MDNKNKVVVRIGGREYAMRGTESEEYIHKVAIFVDRRMEEIAMKQPPLSLSMLAILTSINLADEVIKQKEEIDQLRQELEDNRAIIKKTERERPKVYEMPKKVRR